MSINIPTDTYNYIWHIPSLNLPDHLDHKLFEDLNNENRIYEIDLDSRTIYGPETLSCQFDHNAEIIVFKVDRYHGTIDLANTCCVVQYVTTDQYGDQFIGLYPVPYYDILTCQFENKILIPWSISRAVTQAAKTISYNIRFYHVSGLENIEDVNSIDSNDGLKLDFNLNTKSTSAVIVQSLPVSDDDIEHAYQDVEDAFAEDLDNHNYETLQSLLKYIKDEQTLYWRDASSLEN